MMNHGESIQMSETNGRILVQYFPKRGPIVTLTEWFGRTAGEFLAAMNNQGYTYTVTDSPQFTHSATAHAARAETTTTPESIGVRSASIVSVARTRTLSAPRRAETSAADLAIGRASLGA